ncbi:MAG TPA: MFS transporter [Stellaceae bacterium]|jgi:MFS family permease|nr:MFS transporter [Stellaceae bacterium]
MSTDQQSLGLADTLAAGRAQGVTWRQWAMVCVLTLLFIYAQIDSGSITLLVGPIKQDIGASDTQMGLLLGLSFAAPFAILGLPAGYLVDRMSRRRIIGVGVVLWSAMTLSCGLASTYWQFFLGRSGIGIGEAAITPASYSLFRDSFPIEKRGRAFGIFTAGNYIGAAAGVMITGALAGLVNSGALKSVPWLGGLHAWQAVLVIIGAIGIPLSLLSMTFREPPRRSEGPVAQSGVTFQEAIDQIKSNWRTYVPLVTWITCFFGVAITYGSWMPTIISRTWALPPAQIGLFFGACLLICAPIGAWCGGHIIDILQQRGRRDAAEIVGVWVTIIFIPFGIAAPIVPQVGQMFFALGAQLLVAGAYQPVGASLLAKITPPRVMGKVTAVYLLVYYLIGRGLGPFVVALVSDHFYSGPQALGYGLGTVTAILMFLGLAMIWTLLRRARRSALVTA